MSSGGVKDLALARLDGATGMHVWSKSLGGPGATLDGAARPAVGGGALVVASLQGTADFGGGPITSVAPSSLGFALRLDASGAYQWHRTGVNANLDACGATMLMSYCSTCGPASTTAMLLERIAP